MRSQADADADTAFFRELLADDPDLVSVRVDLAGALLAAGEPEAAIAEATGALARDPASVPAWLVRATARKALGDVAEACADFQRAAWLAPERPMILVNLAHGCAELSRLDEAERHLRLAVALAPDCAEAHSSLGSVLVRRDRLAEAEAPCRAALALDPRLIAPHQNLSAILAATDPDAARVHRDAAYHRRQIFVDAAARPERSVLVLTAASAASVPLQHLLARDRVTRIFWYVDYATADQDRALPPHDLVFNGIGDPDLAPVAPPALERLLRTAARPLLNDPARIARTRRSDLPGLLAGLPGVVVPPVIRHAGPLPALPSGFSYPVLTRPVGSHGGERVRLVADAAGLPDAPEATHYVTQFVDTVSRDGWYRKYRMILVDRRPYPWHLAVSRHWLVHYVSAGMECDPARRREDERFLADPEAALGPGAMAALRAIGGRLDLDYAGIDFALLPDGRILVFEANATMLVHPEPDPRFAYRDPAFRAIRAAFAAMLDARMLDARVGGRGPPG
jgi:Flp pilus assembly protein TadD